MNTILFRYFLRWRQTFSQRNANHNIVKNRLELKTHTAIYFATETLKYTWQAYAKDSLWVFFSSSLSSYTKYLNVWRQRPARGNGVITDIIKNGNIKIKKNCMHTTHPNIVIHERRDDSCTFDAINSAKRIPKMAACA